jgi:hypothetical protein
MKNILATSSISRRLADLNLAAITLGASMLASTLWGVWATHEIFDLKKREVVTVQLSRIMGEFIEAEARAGRSPEETKSRVQAYLQAVEASVQRLSRDGRTVLVAEAVVAGSTPDLTETVRADVLRRMGAVPDARR